MPFCIGCGHPFLKIVYPLALVGKKNPIKAWALHTPTPFFPHYALLILVITIITLVTVCEVVTLTAIGKKQGYSSRPVCVCERECVCVCGCVCVCVLATSQTLAAAALNTETQGSWDLQLLSISKLIAFLSCNKSWQILVEESLTCIFLLLKVAEFLVTSNIIATFNSKCLHLCCWWVLAV